MSSNLGLASVPAVRQYLQLAQALELNVVQALAQAQIPSEIIEQNDQHIAGENFQTLIKGLLAQTDDPLFGLHTAQYVQPASYSVLGFITMNCQTLGEAISKIQPFEKLVGDMGTTSLSFTDDYVKIQWHCRFTDSEVKRHSVDNCLASWVTFARFLTAKQGKPIQVRLQRKQPSLQDCLAYQALFDCSILFEQNEDAILFEKRLLDLPLSTGNKTLLPTLEQHAQQLLEQAQPLTVSQQVSYLLKQQLIDQQAADCKQSIIASKLKISDKTLQRRLQKEQTSYEQLWHQVRLAHAKELLLQTALPLQQISGVLAFNEPRSFYRWFKQRTELTPGAFRQQHQSFDTKL